MGRFKNIGDYENLLSNEGNKICRNCTNLVTKGRRNYCSENCLTEFNNNHDWNRVRWDVLRRDNFTCSICTKKHRKFQLDVDHIIPVRLGIDPFNKKNLRLLCKECHKAKTKLDREFD